MAQTEVVLENIVVFIKDEWESCQYFNISNIPKVGEIINIHETDERNELGSSSFSNQVVEKVEHTFEHIYNGKALLSSPERLRTRHFIKIVLKDT